MSPSTKSSRVGQISGVAQRAGLGMAEIRKHELRQSDGSSSDAAVSSGPTASTPAWKVWLSVGGDVSLPELQPANNGRKPDPAIRDRGEW